VRIGAIVRRSLETPHDWIGRTVISQSEEAELNIELDGSQHGFPDQRKHEQEREKFLKSRGIKTLRFWNSHLRRNVQSIRNTIFRELQARAPHPLPDYMRLMMP